MNKNYDLFEQFDGYAFGVDLDDGEWYIISGDDVAKNVWDITEEDSSKQNIVDTFGEWIKRNSFPEVDHIKDCIEFFEFSLEKNNRIKTNRNGEIFKKARNYFIRHKQIILNELIRLDKVYKEQEDFLKKLPEEVPIAKSQLEPAIVVGMSAGLPEAYIRIIEERKNGDGKVSYFYGLCQPGSRVSEKAPIWVNMWCNIINKLLKQNADLFKD
jgi:hypothetical protein